MNKEENTIKEALRKGERVSPECKRAEVEVSIFVSIEYGVLSDNN